MVWPTPVDDGSDLLPAGSLSRTAGDHLHLLLFRVGDIQLATPATTVAEILIRDAVKSFPIPNAPLHIPGVIDLRGRAIPLLDLRVFLDLPERKVVTGIRSFDAFTGRVAVIADQGMVVGLICDVILGIVEMALDDLEPPDIIQGVRLKEYASGEMAYRERMTAVLDMPRLIAAAKLQI